MNPRPFFFIETSPRETELGTELIVISDGVDGKASLLEILADKLCFPSHFGKNWDALFDCLTDLEWLKAEKVVLVHEQMPQLENETEMQNYIELLRDAVIDWRGRDGFDFQVGFREADRREVEAFLAST